MEKKVQQKEENFGESVIYILNLHARGWKGRI